MMTRLTAPCFLLLLCLAVAAFAQDPANPEAMKAEFAKRFIAWKTWTANQPDRAMLTIGNEYRDLVAMGPTAAPFFAEMMLAAKDPREASAMAEALARVTERRFPREQWPEGKYLDPIARIEMYTKWWTEGRKDTKTTFDQLYTRWRNLKAKGVLLFKRDVYTVVYDDVEKTVKPERVEERTELAEVYDAISDLGIDSLPFFIEQFKAGDYDMLPIFRNLTHYVPRGKNAEERANSCIKWWEANKGEWQIPVK